jgi:serine protease SohB
VGEFIGEYGLFLAKAVTVVIALLVIVISAISVAGSRVRSSEDGHIEVRKLNERLDGMRDALREATLDAREFKREMKAERKAERKADKARRKKQSAAPEPAPAHPRTIYVLNFHGDIRAHAVHALREEITAVLTRAEPADSVMVRIESGGGLVHSYGLAAAQLARIRDRGIPLTVCVDKVAASGGYLMACVAQHIVAAPFAMLGSIGVVAQIPNFNRLLRKHDVDYELFTAGQYKRTLTVFGRNTEAGRQKFSEELEDTHALFKEFVTRYRPGLDIDTAATGEVWFGERALGLGLADELGTSDGWLQAAVLHSDVLEIRYIERKRLGERLGLTLETAIERGVTRAVARIGAREDWLR